MCACKCAIAPGGGAPTGRRSSRRGARVGQGPEGGGERAGAEHMARKKTSGDEGEKWGREASLEGSCVCVCVCVCARARARVRACVSASLCVCVTRGGIGGRESVEGSVGGGGAKEGWKE